MTDMKALFVVFHGFSAHSGISKKIAAQCSGLTAAGVPTELCYQDITQEGMHLRMVDDKPIRNFGSGTRAKIAKRICFSEIADYIRREGIGMLYIRYDHNASPILLRFLKQARRAGAKIALEIPTYPYDREFAQLPLSYRIKFYIERLFRRRMAHSVDRIVTFSDDERIFGCPTIRISNGIDFDTMPLKAPRKETAQELHLLAVANIHTWHGFDRVIEGLRAYYATPRERIVRLHIVGDGMEELIESYRRMIEAYGLGDYIDLKGALSGEALDTQFAWCDMGIASLGRHRSGITHLKSLKNREYAARGIPFVYSETDDDFETMPYVLKAPADETPLNIEALTGFYDRLSLTPQQIRDTIAGTLSWKRQMGIVAEQIAQLPK